MSQGEELFLRDFLIHFITWLYKNLNISNESEEDGIGYPVWALDLNVVSDDW